MFDNKFKLGARLDQIRSNGIVTVVGGQNAKNARPIWLKNLGNTYLAKTLKYVKKTISESRTWSIRLFKPGVLTALSQTLQG